MRPAFLLLATVALAAPAAAQLVDATPPGALERLLAVPAGARVEVEAHLPADDDVTQVRFRLIDAQGAELSRHFAPAGPGERVHVALPLPPDAATLSARVADGAGNPGPEARVAVDGSLATLSVPREAPFPVLLAALALGLAALRRP